MRLERMIVSLLVVGWASWAHANEGEGGDPEDVASESAPAEDRGMALSVGTGPLPLNTISFGLTGLAGRLLFPTQRGSILLSGGHTSFRGSNFPDQGFSDRDFTRAGATTVMLGYRGGSPPEDASVVPYGIAGGMLMYGATAGGDTDRKGTTGIWSVGVQGGMGLDAFITPALSAGLEVGGMGFMALGGSRWDGDDQGKFSALALTSFASAQLTVWR